MNGKAITILIAAISPAAINYGDTISTLRFADNAKRLKVKPQKKLDPTAQMIADLKEENERLRHRVAQLIGGNMIRHGVSVLWGLFEFRGTTHKARIPL